jgi:hypothetical protein
MKGRCALLVLLLLCACRSRAVIDSVPRGASVIIDGTKQGVTPLVIDMHAHNWLGGRRRVLIEKPGFRSRYGVLDTRYDARHLWLSPLVLTLYGTALVVHPSMSCRLMDHYLVVLDEETSAAPPRPALEVFYGRVFVGDRAQRERQRQELLMEIDGAQ